MLISHKLFTQEGIWLCHGQMLNPNGEMKPFQTQIHIFDLEDEWQLMCFATVKDKDKFNNQLISKISFTPVGEKVWAKTTQEHAVFGTLIGDFTFIGDTLLAYTEAKDHDFHTLNTLVRMEQDLYLCRGIAHHESALMSAWGAQYEWWGTMDDLATLENDSKEIPLEIKEHKSSHENELDYPFTF